MTCWCRYVGVLRMSPCRSRLYRPAAELVILRGAAAQRSASPTKNGSPPLLLVRLTFKLEASAQPSTLSSSEWLLTRANGIFPPTHTVCQHNICKLHLSPTLRPRVHQPPEPPPSSIGHNPGFHLQVRYIGRARNDTTCEMDKPDKHESTANLTIFLLLPPTREVIKGHSFSDYLPFLVPTA